MSSPFKGTTICAVRKNGVTAIAGDGQVTMGEHTIFKTTAKKVRRLYNGEVAVCAKSLRSSCRKPAAASKRPPWPWPRPGAAIRPCASWNP